MSVTQFPLDERERALRAAFGSDVFTVVDARGALRNYSRAFTYDTLRALVERGVLNRTTSRKKLLDYLPPYTAADYFSFDFSKTEDDVLEKFDPIPPDERTLDVQLFGDAQKRYLEIREQIFGGKYKAEDERQWNTTTQETTSDKKTR